MNGEGVCWFNGPEHDWVPEGDGWLCDRCEEYDED